MMKIVKKTQGYTLIETLVAITILMVAIAGPLTVANKALTSSMDARNQVIAYNLAQESMEDIKNYRSLNTWPPTGQLASCTTAGSCGTYAVSSGVFTWTNCAGVNCALYTGGSLVLSPGYSYDTTGTITPFTRSFYFTAIPGDVNAVYVTVVVQWNTGTLPNQVKLQELMTNFN